MRRVFSQLPLSGLALTPHAEDRPAAPSWCPTNLLTGPSSATRRTRKTSNVSISPLAGSRTEQCSQEVPLACHMKRADCSRGAASNLTSRRYLGGLAAHHRLAAAPQSD